MCDTGGTICKVAEALRKKEAAAIHACFTHAVLSGEAVDKLRRSAIEKIVITNTIPLSAEAKGLDKIHVTSVARLLAKGIKSIHEETSVSSLFI